MWFQTTNICVLVWYIELVWYLIIQIVEITSGRLKIKMGQRKWNGSHRKHGKGTWWNIIVRLCDEWENGRSAVTNEVVRMYKNLDSMRTVLGEGEPRGQRPLHQQLGGFQSPHPHSWPHSWLHPRLRSCKSNGTRLRTARHPAADWLKNDS